MTAGDAPADRRFRTTRWSVVLHARGGARPGSREALAQLCQTYWPPVYAFVRRHVANVADAQDLTQEFFVRMLEKDYLSHADSQVGRFRTFLLTAVQRFLSKEQSKARAQKRGGGRRILSLDFESGERDCGWAVADDTTPEQEFDRRWARQLLDQVLRGLREEYSQSGKEDVFDELKPLMIGSSDAADYRTVAARLGTTTGAVKTAVYRLRKRYCELLRGEIAHTVRSPEEVEDELRLLFNALG